MRADQWRARSSRALSEVNAIRAHPEPLQDVAPESQKADHRAGNFDDPDPQPAARGKSAHEIRHGHRLGLSEVEHAAVGVAGGSRKDPPHHVRDIRHADPPLAAGDRHQAARHHAKEVQHVDVARAVDCRRAKDDPVPGVRPRGRLSRQFGAPVRRDRVWSVFGRRACGLPARPHSRKGRHVDEAGRRGHAAERRDEVLGPDPVDPIEAPLARRSHQAREVDDGAAPRHQLAERAEVVEAAANRVRPGPVPFRETSRIANQQARPDPRLDQRRDHMGPDEAGCPRHRDRQRRGRTPGGKLLGADRRRQGAPRRRPAPVHSPVPGPLSPAPCSSQYSPQVWGVSQTRTRSNRTVSGTR